MEELNLFVKSIFVDNMIFAYFLGMCSYLAVSKNVKTAFGLGVAVTFMLIVTLPLNYLLDKYILQPGALAWLGEEFKDVDLSFLGLLRQQRCERVAFALPFRRQTPRCWLRGRFREGLVR